ncbi:hypothetical protein EUGRSUZ_C00148 [Eucalyptus grandis]|uniref:Uncharacterized protein n=2 Tax=Eucalyptus grandis TaxID=71139 RepID=A0ACC3L9Q0_EUCGR|nr:hypothetical protein EUGRSUZ_C00148 [Eucalyptus grandis]
MRYTQLIRSLSTDIPSNFVTKGPYGSPQLQINIVKQTIITYFIPSSVIKSAHSYLSEAPSVLSLFNSRRTSPHRPN